MAFYFCWNFEYLNERRTVLMNWFSIWFIYLSLSDCSHIAVKRWTKDNVETNSICLSLRSGFWQFRLSLQLFVLECKCYKILSFSSDLTHFFPRKKNIAHTVCYFVAEFSSAFASLKLLVSDSYLNIKSGSSGHFDTKLHTKINLFMILYCPEPKYYCIFFVVLLYKHRKGTFWLNIKETRFVCLCKVHEKWLKKAHFKRAIGCFLIVQKPKKSPIKIHEWRKHMVWSTWN